VTDIYSEGGYGDIAKGKYTSGLDKEGVVVRTREYSRVGNDKLSFKVIYNEFLSKEKD